MNDRAKSSVDTSAVNLENVRAKLATRGIRLVGGQIDEAITVELRAEQITLRVKIETQLDERGMRIDGFAWGRHVEELMAAATAAIAVYTRWMVE